MATNPQDEPPPSPTIHEAERASGPSGFVEWGDELTSNAAVERRKQGLDIVVRGGSEKANRNLAGEIEAAVGPRTDAQPPHTKRAGIGALPHFHQQSRSPDGHSFYETTRRKARRRR